jgi:hypothetical protein
VQLLPELDELLAEVRLHVRLEVSLDAVWFGPRGIRAAIRTTLARAQQRGVTLPADAELTCVDRLIAELISQHPAVLARWGGLN